MVLLDDHLPGIQGAAENVLATTWAGYAQAMVSNNRGLLIGFTTRSALNDSVATLDCGCLSGPLTYSTTAISAPPQVGYPLSFMAGLSGTGYNQLSQTWWVIFTKTSASAPWLVAFIAGYAEGGGLNGFTAFSALSPAPVPYPLQDAPRAYADFYQKLDETLDAGTGAPTNFAHNNLLEDEVNNTTEIDEQQKAEGLKQTFTHSVDQVSPIFAQVIHGSLYGSMECFSIREGILSDHGLGEPGDRRDHFGERVSDRAATGSRSVGQPHPARIVHEHAFHERR